MPGPSIAVSRRALAIVVVLAGALLIGIVAVVATNARRSSQGGGDAGTTGPSVPAGRIPAFSHVYLIVLENHSLADVVQTGAMPYLDSLIARGALATNYSAVARPSQPNYLALFSGDTHGVTDDRNHDLSAPTIADQLEAHGRTWRAWAENLPAQGCFTGATARDGVDGPGTYARKHEPAISFGSISESPDRCRNIQPLSAFDPGAADFHLIVPNLCRDAHDCPLSAADDFLASFVPRILESGAWRVGGVLFVTFDEGSKDHGQTVPLVAVSPYVRAGTRSAAPYSHYSLLRTIEDAWGLECLARACAAHDVADLFEAGPGASPTSAAARDRRARAAAA
jgi:phosphatidylinositol-3-phosphatase